MSAAEFSTGRRQFLLGMAASGSALLVGCASVPLARLGSSAALPAPDGAVTLNAWLRIAADNTVTVAVARAEMGQGISTALPMLVAEELDCAWQDVRYELVVPQKVHGNVVAVLESAPFRNDDTGAMANVAHWLLARIAGSGQLITGGSTSVRDGWQPLRLAGAAARHALVAAAATRWQLASESLRTEAGHVIAPDGRRLSFGQLAQDAAAIPVPAGLAVKPMKAFRLLGKSLPRLDVPAKTNGSAGFGADLRLPGMLFAAAQMCPVAGGTLLSFDAAEANAIPGVQKVLACPSHFGSNPAVLVIATDFWSARRGAEAVKAQWNEGAHASYDSEAYLASLQEAVRKQTGTSWHAKGDLAAAEKAAIKRVEAEYSVPLLAHAAIETGNCTVLYESAKNGSGPRLKIWAPTQMPGLNTDIAAKVAGLDPQQIVVQPTLIGGGFGYKGLIPDLVVQAVSAAMALPGTPVQLIWTRENDVKYDLYRPPAAVRMTATLDAQNNWSGWHHRSAGPSVIHSLLGRQAPAWLTKRIPDKSTIEGAFDKTYAVPAQRMEHVTTLTTAPLGFWRSVGHSHQAFFVESFVDEVAHAAQRDPLAFRLELLRDMPQQAKLLQTAADAAGWGKPLPKDVALGLALHESFGSVCAQVAEVHRTADGSLRLTRVVSAVDCGTALHPDIIAQQMESAVLFGLTAALYGKISIREGKVEQSNFYDYRLIDMAHSPRVETIILPSDAPPGGIGEVGTPPIAPALCNAIFRLTGQRIRALPIAEQVTFA